MEPKVLDQREFEQVCEVLGEISSRFPAGSREYEAIHRACEALLFVYGDETRTRFVAFMRRMKGGLTPAQVLHLRAIGIDPDTMEDEEG